MENKYLVLNGVKPENQESTDLYTVPNKSMVQGMLHVANVSSETAKFSVFLTRPNVNDNVGCIFFETPIVGNGSMEITLMLGEGQGVKVATPNPGSVTFNLWGMQMIGDE